jgi:hypothetical protein
MMMFSYNKSKVVPFIVSRKNRHTRPNNGIIIKKSEVSVYLFQFEREIDLEMN